MTLKEALHDFGKEYGDIKERLLLKHLSQKYAKQFFQDHEVEFKEECLMHAEELYKKYPAQVREFMITPLFNPDGTMNNSIDTSMEV